MRLFWIVLLLLGCALSSGPRPELERFHGAFSTHFGGIPDQAQICAVITNPGALPVQWLRLRLESFGAENDRRPQYRSDWVYRGELAPGQRVALRFPDAPVSAEFRVRLRDSGRNREPRGGRTLEPTESCSEQQLIEVLEDSYEERAVAEVDFRPLPMRDQLPAPSEELIADSD